jgi:formamidopyrimidine-DNA glycosylase
LILQKKIYENAHLKILGPEPFNDLFNLKYFKDYLSGKNRTIKDLLMDQKFIAGLGNIYCNEILFLCKISPKRIVKKINKQELIKIIKFTKKVLKRSISQGGSSIKDFASTDGQSGNFQQKFNVYNREKKKCKTRNCPSTIRKAYLSRRSSFFCPRCQK